MMSDLRLLDVELAFDVFQQFVAMMLQQPKAMVSAIGEQKIEKIFMNLIHAIFKEKTVHTNTYIAAILTRKFFEDVLIQINAGNM